MKHFSAIILSLFVLTAAAFAQSSAFNYQGKLTESGAASNGTYLFQFKLYDAAGGGAQVGTTLNDISINVTDGTFSTELNFGSNAFTGGDRYIEISVKKTAGDQYTLLTPRQKVNSSPYATKALNAKGYVLEVSGYADSNGSIKLNQALSARRADAVIRYLVESHNIPLRRIVTPFGYGETNPVADNESKEGRAQNRRVEIKLLVNKGLTSPAPAMNPGTSGSGN